MYPRMRVLLAGMGHCRQRRRARMCPWVCIVLLAGVAACRAPDETVVNEAPSELPSVAFEDVTLQAGLGGFQHLTGAFGQKWFPETMGAGAGFLDYDGDGLLDILLVGGNPFPSRSEFAPPALRLYRNVDSTSFEEVTEAAGLGALWSYAFGITSADYDNDGDPDVFVTALFENLLLRNDHGVFTEVAAAAGLADEAAWSTAAVFVDADRDGFLDLYVGNYVDWGPDKDIVCTRVGDRKAYCTPELYNGLSGAFYRNSGDGTFTRQSGVFDTAPGKTLGALSVDYNRDGWSDLIVANDTQRDLLFENQGDGTFVEKGVYSGIAFDENGRARAGMGLDIGVVDETGEVTLFVGHFTAEMVGVYRHTQNGFFVDRAAVSQIGRPSLRTLTFGLFLFDVDRDRDLDLFTANGHIIEEIGLVEEGITYRQRPQLYINQGAGLFAELSASSHPLLTRGFVGRGAAYGDYDRDGDLDVLFTENGGPAHLWRNDTPGGGYLEVRLEGTASNRDGVGARVVVLAGGRHQEREVRAGASYLSQSQQWPHFGLGAVPVVDSLWVYWPNGAVYREGPIAINQVVQIVEQ